MVWEEMQLPHLSAWRGGVAHRKLPWLRRAIAATIASIESTCLLDLVLDLPDAPADPEPPSASCFSSARHSHFLRRASLLSFYAR